MGVPAHYASELPKRLGFLVDKIYPIVKGGIDGDQIFGGQLGTTFLLAMATPMLVLPIERIVRSANGLRVMGNDLISNAAIGAGLAKAFATGQSFGKLNIAVDATGWSYLENRPRFDIANAWSDELLAEFDQEQARTAARDADAAKILKVVRDALSHGGITYLNANGRHVVDGEVSMIVFSAHVGRSGNTYNLVRVTEVAFHSFLIAWANWLNQQE